MLLNALMGLPPVVVGLLVYLMLSRAGPLGQLGILFTPAAMVIAQTILIVPIVAALSRQVIEDAWQEYHEQLRSLGAGPLDVGADPAMGHALLAGDDRAGRIRPRSGGSRRGHDRRRQHRRRDARDDDRDRARNEQGRSSAGARPGHRPASRWCSLSTPRRTGSRKRRSGATGEASRAAARSRPGYLRVGGRTHPRWHIRANRAPGRAR